MRRQRAVARLVGQLVAADRVSGARPEPPEAPLSPSDLACLRELIWGRPTERQVRQAERQVILAGRRWRQVGNVLVGWKP